MLHCGFTPVFVDIDPRTLGMDTDAVLAKITPRTRAVFLTHVLGYNALTRRLLDELKARRIPLIEDVCESHGATFDGRKLGTFGLASNFSFYYAHHLSTIEGGMVCTDDDEPVRGGADAPLARHGARAEHRAAGSATTRTSIPDLNPDFIFAFPAFNVRSTEINAVIGRSQLRRLDDNNQRRTENFMLFLRNLDPNLYRTDFATEGSSNYAFTLVLKEADPVLCERVMAGAARRTASSSAAAPRAAATSSASRTCARLARRRRVEAVPEGGPRPLLRLLHRQLPDAWTRTASSDCATC